MLDFFANLFGYILNFIYNLVNNYGLAIIIFTVLLKLLMLPMTISQQKTMKKNNKIQNLSKEIQNKYSNDPQRMNQEIMNLYKQEKSSPFAGCLSSILQIIVVLSIFFIVSKPLTYMKKVDNAIIDEYTQVLKIEEGETGGRRQNYIQIAIIKKFASQDDRLNINMNFLGLDLSDTPVSNLTNWRVYIIPILYIVTSMASMKMNTISAQKEVDKKKSKEKVELDEKGNVIEKDDKSAENMNLEMNKNMMYIMPVMTISIAFVAPLGLALYWFISSFLMIVERLIMNKIIKEDEE